MILHVNMEAAKKSVYTHMLGSAKTGTKFTFSGARGAPWTDYSYAVKEAGFS